MKATIYHNPRCSTSRNALSLLQVKPGIEVEVVEYLKTPPKAAELARLYARACMTPAQGLRRKEAAAADLAGASDERILEAMAANPILIERPLVETEKGVRLGRPIEAIEDIL